MQARQSGRCLKAYFNSLPSEQRHEQCQERYRNDEHDDGDTEARVDFGSNDWASLRRVPPGGGPSNPAGPVVVMGIPSS